MPRIPLIAPEAASPEVAEIYEKTLRGKPGNAQKALAHRPERLQEALEIDVAVQRAKLFHRGGRVQLVQRFGLHGTFQVNVQLGFGQIPREIVHTAIRLS